MGGSPTRRCRSEEPDFTSFVSNSWMRASAALEASASALVTGRAEAADGALLSPPIFASIGIETAADERRGRAGASVTCTSLPAWRISTSMRLPSAR